MMRTAQIKRTMAATTWMNSFWGRLDTVTDDDDEQMISDGTTNAVVNGR